MTTKANALIDAKTYCNSLNVLGQHRAYEIIRKAEVPAAEVRLSVVIPSFNTAQFIVDAVQSVARQTYRYLEIIVVDDGSSDESLAKILSIKDERLTCVRQSNRGLAGARNTGLLLARGTYVGFLDSDDIWFPRKVDMQLAAMERDPSIGLTFSHSAYLNEEGAPTGQLLISRCAKPQTRDLIRRNHVGNGSTPILRRACLEVCGGFDESIRNCEEWELWVRLSACTPFTIQLVPEALTGYRIRPNSLSVSYEHFILNGELAVERFRHYVPGFSGRDARRACAQNCRIASRKALSNGQVGLSRTLFLRAFRQYPALVLSDVRAAGLALIHLASLPLPDRSQLMVYRTMRQFMKAFYSRLFPAPIRPDYKAGKEDS